MQLSQKASTAYCRGLHPRKTGSTCALGHPLAEQQAVLETPSRAQIIHKIHTCVWPAVDGCSHTVAVTAGCTTRTGTGSRLLPGCRPLPSSTETHFRGPTGVTIAVQHPASSANSDLRYARVIFLVAGAGRSVLPHPGAWGSPCGPSCGRIHHWTTPPNHEFWPRANPPSE